jgi:UDP-N-acetylmuramate: L-alanyl-gamma-D-glutamyl-meso-diaminopimelate ligase
MNNKRVHILGICGTFMGGLALLAREYGFQVTGCDENIYPPMSDHLSDQGINIIPGYNAGDLPEADVYLIGNAMSRGNEAVEYLLNKKKNLVSGPEWLYQNILRKKR